MEEKKGSNTNKLLIIIIILLSLLVGGLVGYIVCDSIVKNDSSNETVEEQKEPVKEDDSDNVVELSLEDEFVQKMFKTHDYFLSGNDLIKYLYANDSALISSLPNESKRYLFLEPYLLRLDFDKKDENHSYYYPDTVLTEWKKLFGTNVEFPFTGDIDEHNMGFTTNNTYQHCNNCGGDVGLTGTDNKLLRVTKNKDEIVLYEAVKFLDFDANDSAIYYKNYEKTIKTTKEEEIPANYKFIYKYDKEIDNYYFHSVEKIK